MVTFAKGSLTQRWSKSDSNPRSHLSGRARLSEANVKIARPEFGVHFRSSSSNSGRHLVVAVAGVEFDPVFADGEAVAQGHRAMPLSVGVDRLGEAIVAGRY